MGKITLVEIRELLDAVEVNRQQKGISRHQLADTLGIPFDTFRKWFSEKAAKIPSKNLYLLKLKEFAEEWKQPSIQDKELPKDLREETKPARTQWEELWVKIQEWWRKQHRYSSLPQLAEKLGWPVTDLRKFIESESTPPRLVVEKLAQIAQLQYPPTAIHIKEVKRRVERLKALLTILAEELAYFRDGSKEDRDIYRSELDQFDTGYISSLLTMLFAEDKYLRWLEVTTNRFNSFKAKGR